MHHGDGKINKTMYAAMYREATKWLSGWVEEDRGHLSWKERALVQAPVQMPKPVGEQCYWWQVPTVTSGYRGVTLAGAFDTQDDERRLLHLLSFYMAARYAFLFTLWRQANPPRSISRSSVLLWPGWLDPMYVLLHLSKETNRSLGRIY